MLILGNGRANGGRLMAIVITAVMMFVSFDSVAGTAVNEHAVVRSKTVRFDGASLENPVKAHKLYTRLRLAAKMVCRQASDESSNGRAASACEEAAVKEAVACVNNVSITAIHRARVGDDAMYRAWLMAPTPCAQCG